jgi:hypothetical protein
VRRRQAREKLSRLERLRHVVVRAGVEPLDLVRGGRAGREHEDGDGVALVAQLVHDLDAVHAGEHDIHDDGVVQAALRGGEAGVTVVHGLAVESGVGHDADDGIGKVPLVLHDKYVHGASLGF